MEMYKMKSLFLFLLLLLSCAGAMESESPWVNLFDGKTLTGWQQMGGAAIYEVRDGKIVGTTVADTPNSFLTTLAEYDDFILEVEFKVDPPLNSGIQVRSKSSPQYKDGRVHGYQVEIDPTKRAMSGGIYDEARRGWLYKLDDNPRAQQAFKLDDWNHYRVEAIGDTIKTWVNGIPAAHIIDNVTAKGFIGLQVHSLHKGEDPGLKVAWRKVKIITKNPMKYSKKSPLKPIYITE